MKTIGEVYLHVGNSGATISVVDDGQGPELRIGTSSFGNLIQGTVIKTNIAAFRALRDLFSKATEESYSAEYCNVAFVPTEDGKDAQAAAVKT